MKRFTWILFLLLLLVPKPGLAINYSFEPIDHPWSWSTYANDINNNGQIVGWSNGVTGTHGYIRDADGDFSSVGDSLTADSGIPLIPLGINDSGQIAGMGVAFVAAFGFLLDGGDFNLIMYPGSLLSAASGVNNGGLIAGAYYENLTTGHGYLRDTSGGFTPIDYPGASTTEAARINDSDQIVGSYKDATGWHGYLRIPGGEFSPIDYPGAPETRAFDINNNGNIVGWYEDTTGIHGFLRDGGGDFSPIDYPGASETRAMGINEFGQVVGWYQEAEGWQGFLATPNGFSHPFTNMPHPNLCTTIICEAPLSLPESFSGTGVPRLGDGGWFYGYQEPPANVPEPSTLLLIGSGLAGLVGLKRKFRGQKDPDMLEEYDFSKGIQGKYAKKFAEGIRVVVIEPDIVKFLHDHDSVDQALRLLSEIIKKQKKIA